MAHRHKMEEIQVQGNEKRMDDSQRNGFYVGLTSLAGGTTCIISTNSWYGMVAGIAIVAIGVGGLLRCTSRAAFVTCLATEQTKIS